MATPVDICNMALERLGADRITSLTADGGDEALRCAFHYDNRRQELLRSHPWTCATKRAFLPKLPDEDIFDEKFQYYLPNDFMRLVWIGDLFVGASQYDDEFDDFYQREGDILLTTLDSPLKVRYVFDLENVDVMDELFRFSLSRRMAMEMCEGITQSNTKMREIKDEYRMAISEAKKTNAIERPPQRFAQSSWVTGRL